MSAGVTVIAAAPEQSGNERQVSGGNKWGVGAAAGQPRGALG